MREIKFRGKRIDTGEWVFGCYLEFEHNDDKTHKHTVIMKAPILEHPIDKITYEVIPETVGQYTGLKDENGKEIYKGDIAHCISHFDNANMVVIYEDGEFRMVLCEKYKTYETGGGFYAIRCFKKEIIGNIYDNPELIHDQKAEV